MCKRAYSRCNSGHYFLGAYCPFDGWSSPATKELSDAVQDLKRARKAVSFSALRKIGVSEETIALTIIIEFGSEAFAFEGISPQTLFVNDKSVPVTGLDEDFT